MIYEAVLNLEKQFPELMCVLAQCDIVHESNITSYVYFSEKSNRFKINLSPQHITDIKKATGIITHELMHIVFDHVQEGIPSYIKKLSEQGYSLKDLMNILNVAMDCIINENSLIKESGLDGLCLLKNVAPHLNTAEHTSKDVFDHLFKNSKKVNVSSLDDHSKFNSEDENDDGKDKKTQPPKASDLLSSDELESIGKAAGNKELLDKIKTFTTDRKDSILKKEISKFLTKSIERKSSIAKASRRGISLFGKYRKKNKSSLVIDTSGSMCDEREVKLIDYCFNQCLMLGDVDVYMGDCSLGSTTKNAKKLPEIVGGGGSDFRWLKDISKNCETLIFVSDAYITDLNDLKNVDLLLCTTDQDIKNLTNVVRLNENN